MSPDIPIFKPRYSAQVRLMILLPVLIFFGLICSAALSGFFAPVAVWVLVLLVGLAASLIPFFLIREVRFPDEMVVRRHFLPDYFFSHQEFEQIQSGAILAGGKRIPTGPLTNHQDLVEMAQRWRSTKLLKASRPPKSEIRIYYPQRGYGTYASFWGLMFAIIVVLISPPGLGLDPRWLLGGTFLLVYIIYSYIIPRFL